MVWQGANVERRPDGSTEAQQDNADARWQQQETVEASLNRLSKAYNSAMQCVGALHIAERSHATSSAPGREPDEQRANRLALRKVAHAARRTFEEAILKDPLVASVHAPLLCQTLSRHRGDEESDSPMQGRRRAVELRSEGHKSSVKQLAYLSLVNYADLLLAGCGPAGSGSQSTSRKVLDRGLVKSLATFSDCSCWLAVEASKGDISPEVQEAMDTDVTIEEPVVATVRLALTAYIDATEVDGTDPTVWIKLACTARRLGRLVSSQSHQVTTNVPTPVFLLPYRRLEKHALEAAYGTLPSTVAPNRMAIRALEEWQREDEECSMMEYAQELLAIESSVHETKLSIPRYSWSTMGRMLIRACKDDLILPYTMGSSQPHPNTMLSLHLSPLLVLPSSALGRICRFLDSAQICRFEATCRGLSALILSARAALDHEAVRRETKSSSGESSSISMIGTERQDTGESSTSKNGNAEKRHNNASRASKRVRSQIITSGKRAERQSRRTVQSTLLALTLGTDSNSSEYKKLIAANFDWNALVPGGQRETSSGSHSHKKPSMPTDSHLDSSLARFVECWAVVSSRPVDILWKFVAHVSLHVGEVFSSDPGGLNVLTSALLECFDLFGYSKGSSDDTISSWSSGWKAPPSAHLSRIEVYAVDLLHAELRFKRCECEDPLDTDFDGNSSVLAIEAPRLLDAISIIEAEVDGKLDAQKEWTKLKTRCFWLNAGFYLWRGRLSHSISESREAEVEGLLAIQQAMNCLGLPEEQPVRKVRTPHLMSPNRQTQHWRELSALTLDTLANEIRASSVLLRAQEQFLDVLCNVDETEDERALQPPQRESLSSIGGTLYQRYMSKTESSAADYTELVFDFLGEHGDELASRAYREGDPEKEDSLHLWFDCLVPTAYISNGTELFSLQRPCILTILLCCLQIRKGREWEVLELLVNISLAITDLAEEARAQFRKGLDELKFGSCNDFDSDADSLADRTGLDSGCRENGTQRSRIRQYSVFLRLLLHKISLLYADKTSVDPGGGPRRDGFVLLFHRVLRFICFWLESITPRVNEKVDWAEDFRVFQVIQRLQGIIRDRNAADEFAREIEKVYAMGLMGIIQQQRRAFSTLFRAGCDRKGLAARSKIVKQRVGFVAAVCCDLALILAAPIGVAEHEVLCSDLFRPDGELPLTSNVALLCESLVWMWHNVQKTESPSAIMNTSKAEAFFDRQCIEILRVPVGLTIVALCGSAASTRLLSPGISTTEGLGSLVDFYDSDSSALDWLAEESQSERDANRESLLRVVGQLGHCVARVFDSIDEAEAVGYLHVSGYVTPHGPALPLVTARVLNRLADRILIDFAEKGSKDPLWGDYPFGTRSIGRLLDSALHKAYSCLYGFALMSANDCKDSSGPIIPTEGTRKPESFAAAAQLYRCTMRAYSQGRKSPPKVALDTILIALPPLESTPRSKDIHDYLFSAFGDYSSLKELSGFILKGPNWEISFSDVRDWVLGGECPDNIVSDGDALNVRKGISQLIAGGAMPQYPETGSEDEQRSSTEQFEEELCRKFSAILDSLSLGNTDDYEAWYKAGQCLVIKADLIADRLGLSKGYSRGRDFVPSKRPVIKEKPVNIDCLLEQQYHETRLNDEGWTECLGVDLSVYTRFAWSNFDSLHNCSNEVGSGYRTDSDGIVSGGVSVREVGVWQEIDQLRQKSDFVGWQQAWGGLFVTGLRKVAFRCLRLALFILYSEDGLEQNEMLVSEVAESLGVNFYSELLGSQRYGYPMQKLTMSRKRELAQAALSCFERAASVVSSPGKKSLRPVWDLQLMIGKCHEKIAKTLWQETFIDKDLTPTTSYKRKYEHYMTKALDAYHSSTVEAEALEHTNELVVEQHGGSSNGSTEAVYRLHATRLKCLVAAVDRIGDERELAETEALRLGEKHWYAEVDPRVSESLLVRDRIWNVLADVVVALAQCRLDVAYFHRSVYRHAQALLWAPILSDPQERAFGSLGTVPATRAFKLRGLNSTDAASSAAVVMGTLFEKKRSQLCAVWVTSGSSESVFQTLNNSVRKYDSLRGKYIAAYLETLRLCNRRGELEIFLKWAYAAQRDLPSYFAASAAVGCQKPEHGHTHDCLLLRSHDLSSRHFRTAVKRQVNSALASVILYESQKLTPRETKRMENLLKLSYACYLRLNCDVRAAAKGSEWRSNRSSGNRAVVKALTTTYLKHAAEGAPSGRPAEWSQESQTTTILQAALKRCQNLFPTLPAILYSKKGMRARKGELSGKKRKAHTGDIPRRAFEVPVPAGLSAGDTFFTCINVGDKTKKVRLTVPEGASEALRFTLPIKEWPSETKG